jgi:UrcA family protein
MKVSKITGGLLASLIVAALGAPAIAAAADKSDLQGVSVKVSYADLNLEKQEGAKALYRRLQLASRRACDYQSLRIAGSLQRATATKKCYHQSLANAVGDLDNDLVTQIHAS